MADHPVFIRSLFQHLPNPVRDDRARQRRIGRGQPLRNRDEIRLHLIVIRSEHPAQPTKTGHDLIRDQQDIVFLQYRLNSLPITRRRWHDAPGSQHWLTDKGRNGVWPFGKDQPFQRLGALAGERLGALALICAAIVIRGLGVDHERQWQIELLVKQL